MSLKMSAISSSRCLVHSLELGLLLRIGLQGDRRGRRLGDTGLGETGVPEEVTAMAHFHRIIPSRFNGRRLELIN